MRCEKNAAVLFNPRASPLSPLQSNERKCYVHVIIMSWRSAWERIVVKRATLPVVLTVAAAIGLTACASKTETVATAPPPPPPPAYTPPPPPEPYVAPAPTRKYVSKRRATRKARRHARRHKVTTTTTTTPAPSR